MAAYTLEQRWEILRHYFEYYGNVAECVRKLRADYGRRQTPSAPYVHYLVKKWNKEEERRNQSVKRQKQWVYTIILLLWQKVCVKLHQYQFTIVLNNWTFRRHYWDEFCIKTLVWRHKKFNLVQELKPIDHPMRFRFAKWNCDRLIEDADFGKKKSSFQMKLILILAVM